MATAFHKPSPFKAVDWGIWGFLCLGSTLCGVWATLTPGNDLVGLIILWAVCLCFWGIAGLLYYTRNLALSNLQYVTVHGLIVGWTRPEFAIRPEVVENATEDLVVRMLQRYPEAPVALRGCVVLFREPTWLQCAVDAPNRKVAGLQDGDWLYVGFNEDLAKTAFGHELAHRVLQVNANDPSEADAHAIMGQLGVL